MDIEVILKSEEILKALKIFSKALNIGVWLSKPVVDKVEKVTPEWGMKSSKKMFKEVGMLKKECMPGRIKMRKEAVMERKPVIKLCPMKLYIFTAPIFFEGELVGFFEGDGAKAMPVNEEWLSNLEEKQKIYGFDRERVLKEVDDNKYRVVTKEEIEAMISLVIVSIESYLKMIKREEEFKGRVKEFYGNISKLAKAIRILGINAAIESARIGVEGAGFAVVADEIKKIGEEVANQSDSLKEYLENLDKEASDK